MLTPEQWAAREMHCRFEYARQTGRGLLDRGSSMLKVSVTMVGSVFSCNHISVPCESFYRTGVCCIDRGAQGVPKGGQKAKGTVKPKTTRGKKTNKKRNQRARQPRREWASALQGAGAEGQHRATPTRAAAPEAPPSFWRCRSGSHT